MNIARIFLTGLAIVFFGIMLITLGSLGSGNVSAGGVIFIGPIPIVFGSGPNGGLLALISLVASVAIVLWFYLTIRARRMTKQNE